MSKLIKLAEKLLSRHYLCDSCLGRLFGGLSVGLSNKDRGHILKEIVKMDLHLRLLNGKRVPRKLLYSLICNYGCDDVKELASKLGLRVICRADSSRFKRECELCGNLLCNTFEIAKSISEKLLHYEFNKYLVGIKAVLELEKREEEFKKKYGLWFGESIRNEMSREIGKHIKAIFKETTGKEIYYDPLDPEVIIIYEVRNGTINIFSKSYTVEVLLRLKKSSLNIFSPLCDECGGKGCVKCGFIGKREGPYLEYVVGKTLVKYVNATTWKFTFEWIDESKSTLRAMFRLKNPAKRYVTREEILGILNSISNDVSVLDVLLHTE
ncbi:MAG: hypothetical protein QXH96_00235 [Candidatus Geothermarchaeota archaeon]